MHVVKTSRRITYSFTLTLLFLLGSHSIYSQLPLPLSNPLDLLPMNEATHVVQQSGNWTNPETWQEGNVPNSLAKVLIPNGKTLTIDTEIPTRIKVIRNHGKLQFARTVNTALNVETIVQDMDGELEIGTANNPIPANISCKITIIDEGNIDLNTDQWEKGLLLMGKTVVYGAAKTSWTKVAVNPSSGATTLSLQTAPIGWEIGDRIVITGTDPEDAASDEVATIQSISGSTITLAAPLIKNHLSPTADLFVHVANLSRNVVIESEQLTSNNGRDRGHIMFMHTLDVDFNNVRVYGFGRSRKDVPINDWTIGETDQFENGPRTNVRGRYSIHFHRGGVNQALNPAYVRGCVVEDDPGWAYVNHSAFVHFDNNVSYNVIGGGFQTEAGDEIGSFTNNIAIRTVNPDYPLRWEFPENAPDIRENAQDFAFQGDAFWIHGGAVSVTGNVASGASGHAFIYWPEGLIEPRPGLEPFRTAIIPSNIGLPNSIQIIPEENNTSIWWISVESFQNNEAYSAGIGLATFYLHTTFFNEISDYDPNYIATVHSTFEDFTAWNIDQQGIQLNFTERVTFKNIRLVNNDGDPSTIGIRASQYRSKETHIYQNVSIEGFGTGLALPPQGLVTVDCGYLKNGTNLYIPSAQLAPRDMHIEGLTTEPDPMFNNPVDIKMEAFFSPPEDKFPAYFLLPDKIILNYGPYANQRLYFNEQAANYKPLPYDEEPYTFFDEERYILPQFAEKTNQELQQAYQMSFGGSLLPSDAVDAPGIIGGKIRGWQNETLNIPVCVDFKKETEIEEINECISEANSLIEGPLPAYLHPIQNPCSIVGTPLSMQFSNVQDVSCNGASNGAATITVVGGQAPYTYLWSNGASNATVNNLSAGSNSVTVTDNSGLTSSATVTISEPTSISINIDEVLAENGDAMDGSISISVMGGTGSYSFEWLLEEELISITEDPSNLAAGTYTLLIYDANDCLFEQEIIVDRLTSIIDQALDANIKIFPNPSNGQFLMSIHSNIVRSYQFEVYNSVGQQILMAEAINITNYDQSFDLSQQAAGMYWLKISSKEKVAVKKLILVK